MKERLNFFNIILSLLIFFGSLNAFAQIDLNISMIFQKGVDEKLVLKSELHSLESFIEEKKVYLKMKNGIYLNLNSKYIPRDIENPLSEVVHLKGDLVNAKGVVLKLIDMKTPLGVETNIRYSEDQGSFIAISFLAKRKQ